VVIEPGEVAATGGDLGRLGQLAEVGGLARPVAAAEDEPRRVVGLQVVDQGGEEDRLPGPARPDDADPALDRLPAKRAHAATRPAPLTPALAWRLFLRQMSGYA